MNYVVKFPFETAAQTAYQLASNRRRSATSAIRGALVVRNTIANVSTSPLSHDNVAGEILLSTCLLTRCPLTTTLRHSCQTKPKSRHHSRPAQNNKALGSEANCPGWETSRTGIRAGHIIATMSCIHQARCLAEICIILSHSRRLGGGARTT